jgi:hypothetical protein
MRVGPNRRLPVGRHAGLFAWLRIDEQQVGYAPLDAA